MEQLRLKFEFAIKNLPLVKPIKVIFERDPAPYLVLIEAFSQPILTIAYFTAESARNLLVQLAYLVQRVIGMASKDHSIFKSFLSFQFDALKNLSVRDGKLQASVADCLVARGDSADGIMASFNHVFSQLLTRLNTAPGSEEL